MRKVYYNGIEWKMSKKFHVEVFDEDDVSSVLITGSPSDIRKTMRMAEMCGRVHYYVDRPIMREGGIYEFYAEQGENFYHIYRHEKSEVKHEIYG